MADKTYLIAGLGNPGAEYVHTRHNVGFDILDQLAGEHEVSFTDSRYAWKTEIKLKGRTLVLIKPTTYMNLSGNAVQYWLQQYHLKPEQLLVVTDDINLAVGKIRMKAKGSDGGHNGLKHIQYILQTAHYPRLRFGVGNQFLPGQQVRYVLGKWDATEWEALKPRMEAAARAISSFALEGLDRAMNQYNS